MKRFLLSALSVFLVAVLIGLTGCDGGGIEPGMGDTSQPPAVPVEKLKEMANMADGKTPPPSKKVPVKAAEAAAPAADKGKEAPKN